MKRLSITQNGNYTVPVPCGATFDLACSGTFDGAFGAGTLTGWTIPLDRFTGFATTALALTAAGEKTGVNMGDHNEINLAVTSKSGTVAEIIAIVNDNVR